MTSMGITIEDMPGEDVHRRFYRPDCPINADMYDRLRYMDSREIHREHHVIARDGKLLVADLGLQLSPYEDDLVWIKHVTVDRRYRGQDLPRRLALHAATSPFAEGRIFDASSLSRDGAAFLQKLIDDLLEAYPDRFRLPNGREARFF